MSVAIMRHFGQIDDVPMAKTSITSPVWPIPAVTRRRWTFGAHREGKKGPRHHAGLDFYAPQGSEVLAVESGTLIGSQRFLGPRAVALLFALDSGPVILYGEVLPNSWADFGLRIGSHVDAGQPVARVGVTPKGSSMLHFEMYTQGTRTNAQWYKGNPPPDNLLNPTQYLRMAKELDTSQQDPAIEDDDDPTEDPKQNEDPTLEEECGCGPGEWAEFFPGGGCKCHKPTGQTDPTIPGDGSPWGGVVKLALLFGAIAILTDDGR